MTYHESKCHWFFMIFTPMSTGKIRWDDLVIITRGQEAKASLIGNPIGISLDTRHLFFPEWKYLYCFVLRKCVFIIKCPKT